MSVNGTDSMPSKVREMAYLFKVKDAMTTEVISVIPRDTMSVVKTILQHKRISGLPVMEKDQLAGIISIDNFINCILEKDAELKETVDRYMTTDVECLYTDEPLIHAISKFEKEGYGRFPVLQRDTRKVAGVLTKGDIVKCLLKKLEIDYQMEEIRKYRAKHIFQDIGSHKTTLILRYDIRGGEVHAAGEQSGYLKINLLRLGIPPNLARRIVVASCEAEMNIIIFTDGGTLTALVEDDNVTVRAEDNGPGIRDIKKAMQPGFSTAPDWIREMGFGAGMGLPNIKKCTDRMTIDSAPDTGTRLEFTVFLDRDREDEKGDRRASRAEPA